MRWARRLSWVGKTFGEVSVPIRDVYHGGLLKVVLLI
jgi:hypothetical protein